MSTSLGATILVDTSVIIDFLRAQDKSKTTLFALAKKHKLAISILTHAELYAGKSVWENPRAEKELTTLFSGLTVLPVTQVLSKQAGKIRAQYTPDLIDALIAATALHHNLPLATSNAKHFSHIPHLKLY